MSAQAQWQVTMPIFASTVGPTRSDERSTTAGEDEPGNPEGRKEVAAGTDGA